MDALEILFRPVISMVNRQIDAKTPARALGRELDGRTFAVRVSGTALSLYLRMQDGVLSVGSRFEEEPDVVVSGSLLALARLAGPAGESLIRDGVVDIEGDAVMAERFRRLLRYGRPDLEEELSGLVGDAAAHGIGDFLRDAGRWADDAGRTLVANAGEYLKEESRAVPGRYEVEVFRADVNALRDDVARVEARLKALEERRS